MTRSPVLTRAIADFVAHKRALARKYDAEAKTLALFARSLAADRITEVAAVTPRVIEAFLASRPRTTPRSYNHLLGVLRVFFDWSVDFEICPTSPVRARPRRQTRQRLPFLFDLPHAQRLVSAAATLPRPRGRRGVARRDLRDSLLGPLWPGPTRWRAGPADPAPISTWSVSSS